MSIEDGGQAYPMGYHPEGNGADHQGMTLRDYFAGQIAMGLSIRREGKTDEHDAMNAYALADAMIKARGKNGKDSTAVERAAAEAVDQSAEIERLKALHNPELVPAAAHMIVTQRDEIERLRGLLREAAGYLADEGRDEVASYYRDAGEVGK